MPNFFTNNPWLGYADRDYRVMKEAITQKLKNPITGIPEITDHSASNPFIKRVSIWCGIGEMMGYYVDNKGRESFLPSARLYESAINIAKQYDYRVRGRIASTGEVTITLDGPAPSNIVIAEETQFTTNDGIIFSSIESRTILSGETSVVVPVKQWIKVPFASIGTTDGNGSQNFETNINVADGSVAIKVDANPYTSVETFVFSQGSDEHYKQQFGKDLVYGFELGDGINGFLPVAGKNVEAQWYETSGIDGNVGSTLINQLISVVTLPGGVAIESVSNELPTTNGKDYEGLEELRKYIPLSLRTLYRAVTEQDYIDVTLLAPGVSNAGLVYNCGKYVNIYITPNGGGQATPILISETQEFLRHRKMVTTFPLVFAAGLVFVEHFIRVRAKPNYFNNIVKANVLDSLEEYYSNENQEIGGTNYLGNVYEAIELTEGVSSSDVDLMRPVPAGIPAKPTQVPLDWTRQQTDDSVSNSYRITFISPTQYKLFKNNAFGGSFIVGQEVTTSDVVFTINAAGYLASDNYSFETYKSAGNINLSEPSLLSFDVAFITIEVTGGLT